MGERRLPHRGQFHQSRLVESVIPSNVGYQETLRQVSGYFVAHGSSASHAKRQAVAWIGQQIQTQASLLAYIDTFWVLMLVALAMVPLGIALRKVKLGGARPAAH